jgi:predicted RNA-binding Zn ribbon-like protein
MTGDHRVTPGLIHDVLDALERHGCYRGDDQHADRAIGLIGDLAGIYEGTQDHPASAFMVPPPAPADPGPSRAGAVTLTRADAITVFAAAGIAADDKRYRVEMCPDCADQSRSYSRRAALMASSVRCRISSQSARSMTRSE